QIYWKYLTVSDQELINKIKEISGIKEIEKQFETEKKDEQKTGNLLIPMRDKTNLTPYSEEHKGKSPIKDEQENKQKPSKIETSSQVKIKNKKLKKMKENTSGKKGDKFFNKVKEFLSKSSIEILGVEDASKDNLILKIKINDREKLLVAYNKKKIDENDIIKAYKKSSELNLEYTILSLGEPAKKMNEFIEAVKKLDEIKRIE
ncbi:MAG: hypothetical protein AABX44_02320, partial [Nanoarchaeota archaeon]